MQISQEKTCAGFSFSIKLQTSGIWCRYFPMNFMKQFFYRTPSGDWLWYCRCNCSYYFSPPLWVISQLAERNENSSKTGSKLIHSQAAFNFWKSTMETPEKFNMVQHTQIEPQLSATIGKRQLISVHHRNL